MNSRRDILKIAITVGATGAVQKLLAHPFAFGDRDESDAKITLYDTNAMALYMDGSLGPKTGVIKVETVVGGTPVELPFWHGHGGKSHRFTITEADFIELKKLNRVYLRTNVVDGHDHRLFIDPVDPRYRVPGALPVEVEVLK